MISGQFNNCSEVSCSSLLANRSCVAENNMCKCAASDSSSCGTLSQQDFVDITGEESESSSNWSCCYCARNASFCCDKCSSPTALTPAVPPTRYYRIILAFPIECKQFQDHNDNILYNSLAQGLTRLTHFPVELITIKAINCTTGQQPFCGVDVDNFRAHRRARRLVSSRVKGANTKNKNNKAASYSNYDAIDRKCEVMLADITVSGKNLSLLAKSLDLLRHLQANKSLIISLWDGQFISSLFMLSAVDGSLFRLHAAPTTKPPPPLPTESTPPLSVDLMPLIYAGGSILGLVTVCVIWKFIRHSWLLHRKKFTPINSDRVDHKKAKRIQRLREAMEENDLPKHANGKALAPTSSSAPRIGNEAMTQQHNWSSAKSLAPAYEPTKLHNQRTPPKLILDDEGSDIEGRSVEGESIVNSADDENLSDILNTDEESVLRRTSGNFLHGLGNPGFKDEGETFPTEGFDKLNNSKMRKKSTSQPTVANGHALAQSNLSVDNSCSQWERQGSLVSSDLSLEAGDKTGFLPTRTNKTNKQQDSDTYNNGNMLVSLKRKENKVRSASISLLHEEAFAGTTKNSVLTTQNTKDIERRKSMSTSDSQVRLVTPKDEYMKGGKNTKAFTFDDNTKSNKEAAENLNGKITSKNEELATLGNKRRKSRVSAWVHDYITGQSGEKERKSLSVTASRGNERRISFIAEREGVEISDTKETKGSTENLSISVSQAKERRKSFIAAEKEDGKNSDENDSTKVSASLTATKRENRKSLRADEEIESFVANANARYNTEGIRASLAAVADGDKRVGKSHPTTEESFECSPALAENRKSRRTGNAKRKKKKSRNKEAKRNADDSDSLTDMEKARRVSPDDFEGSIEVPDRNATSSEGKESKKKKKKRKAKKVVQRKLEDSEQSDDDVEDKMKEINTDSIETEKRQRQKKRKKVTTSGSAVNLAANYWDEEMDG